jgi:hypothetical protein
MEQMYQCDECKKCFSKKSNFKRHQTRKNPCKEVVIETEEDQIIQCDICKKTFSNKSNLNKHKKNKKCQFDQSFIGDLVSQFKTTMETTISKQLDKVPQSTVVNQITNNHIIQFVLPGQETIGHITDRQFLEALDMDDFQEVLCELMRMTFFNPDAPENNHWCVAYLNGKYGVLQYNPKTDRIERTLTEKAILLHFDNLFYSLGEKMDYFMNELTLTDNQTRNINIFYKYLGTVDPNPEEFNEIKMMAYNNRSIPIELWKSMGIDGEHKKIRL